MGNIGGQPAVVLVQDFAFMGGSLGMAAGEAFIKAAKEAVKREVPFVIFTASGGARMQEGTLSLMQMARTTLALNEVKAAGLPYIVVLTDPTTGGVMASYAMLGDVHLAEPGALIGFAGRRVIEQTIRETLPPGFQRAEFLVERGMVDRVVTRGELPAVLASILKHPDDGARPPRRRLTPLADPDYDPIRASDAVIQRLRAHHPILIDLTTGRVERLLAALGRPQDKRLPPVIHVAGTNGKGSTIAFLRAIAEAAGLKAHALTSPHLVRFAERIRIAGDPDHRRRGAGRHRRGRGGQRRRADQLLRDHHGPGLSRLRRDAGRSGHRRGGPGRPLRRHQRLRRARRSASSPPSTTTTWRCWARSLAKIAWEKAGIIKRRPPGGRRPPAGRSPGGHRARRPATGRRAPVAHGPRLRRLGGARPADGADARPPARPAAAQPVRRPPVRQRRPGRRGAGPGRARIDEDGIAAGRRLRRLARRASSA